MSTGISAANTGTRLVALDVARGVALIGMMAVHVLSGGAGGVSGTVRELAGGRSAALFAVLAGVGLALLSGGAKPDAERVRRARRATLVRATAIAAIGLTVGGLNTPAAVILVYYAVLFVIAVPFLSWRRGALALAAACWAVFSPVVSMLLRLAGLDDGPGPNPFWTDLAPPGPTVLHLVLNGYYPALTWTTYLLAGLAVGRLALERPKVGRRLAAIGAGLAAAGWLAATVCVQLAGGERALAATLPPGALIAGRGDGLLSDSFFGTTPTTSWWFLGVMAPHSGGIPDLVHTTGTALLVIGVSLIVVPRTGNALRPLAAAGSMTLTLYSAHVIALGLVESIDPSSRPSDWLVLATNIAVAIAVASWWGSPKHRGPLEELVAAAVRVAVPVRRA